MKTERIIDLIAYSLLALMCFGTCEFVIVTMYNGHKLFIEGLVMVMLGTEIAGAFVLIVALMIYDYLCDYDEELRVRAQ